MSKVGNGSGKVLSGLRQRIGAAMNRFSAKGAQSPDASGQNDLQFESFDPTRALMPGEPTLEDERGRQLPSLSHRIIDAGSAIRARRRAVYNIGRDLSEAIRGHDGGLKSMLAQGMRALIGLFLILAWDMMRDDIALVSRGGAELYKGAPIADALTIAYLHQTVGIILFVGAIAMALVPIVFGNATDNKMLREADNAGKELAENAIEFKTELTDYREQYTNSNNPTSTVLATVSQAHLTALASKLYFQDIAFLTASEAQDADMRTTPFQQFKRFLAGGGGGGGFSAMEASVLILIAYLIGITFGYTVGSGNILIDIPDIDVVLSNFPQAQLILLALGAYPVMGLFAMAIYDVTNAADITKKSALNALRGSFLENGGPVSDNITSQVDDAVQVLSARLSAHEQSRGTHSAGTGQHANPASNQTGGNFADEGDIPEWRKRDSSVKFVETGFTGTPDQWRTDAFSKKFEAPSSGKTGSKRGPKSR